MQSLNQVVSEMAERHHGAYIIQWPILLAISKYALDQWSPAMKLFEIDISLVREYLRWPGFGCADEFLVDQAPASAPSLRGMPVRSNEL